MNDQQEVIRNSIRKDGSLDWDDVETKVSIIMRRFSTTIDWKYLEDLGQELRIFAWSTSSNYWDMYRRAVDYWRTLTRRVFPEICVFEFDESSESFEVTYQEKEEVHRVASEIRKALLDFDRTEKEKRDSHNCLLIIDVIEKWALGEYDQDIPLRAGKIQKSWVSEKFQIPYVHVQDALWLLDKITSALGILGKIDVPEECKKDYEAF